MNSAHDAQGRDRSRPALGDVTNSGSRRGVGSTINGQKVTAVSRVIEENVACMLCRHRGEGRVTLNRERRPSRGC